MDIIFLFEPFMKWFAHKKYIKCCNYEQG